MHKNNALCTLFNKYSAQKPITIGARNVYAEKVQEPETFISILAYKVRNFLKN